MNRFKIFNVGGQDSTEEASREIPSTLDNGNGIHYRQSSLQPPTPENRKLSLVALTLYEQPLYYTPFNILLISRPPSNNF